MKKQKKILSLLLTLICSTSLTARSEDVVIVEKDKPAPYTGVLFPREKAQEIRIKLLENDRLNETNASYGKSIELYKKSEDIQNQKINTLLEQNDKLAKSLGEAHSTTSFERVADFIGGVLLTSAAVYGAYHLRQWKSYRVS